MTLRAPTPILDRVLTIAGVLAAAVMALAPTLKLFWRVFRR